MARKIPSEKNMFVEAAKVAPTVETELPYPIIQYAENNSLLYPIKAIDGTTATLTLPANATNVMFYMAIKDQDEPSFKPVSVKSGVDVVDISAEDISYCIGHTVLFKYTANAGGRALESLTLELEVQQIREEDLAASRPVFRHAEYESSTWYLRMKKFEDDECIDIRAWSMIHPGQRLFVAVAGNQHVVPYRFIWVALDHEVKPGEAHPEKIFSFPLSRAWLSRLEDYSSITVHMGVIWDKTAPVFPQPGDPLLENPLPVNAQDFHLRTTSLLLVDPEQKKLNPPNLKESVELPPGQWQVNPTNTVNGGHAIVNYDGMFEGDHVCAYASGPDYGPVALGCKDVKKGETSLSYDVAPDIFAALFNKTLTLNYSLQFNSYQPQPSLDRHVKVLAPQLTTPDIEEATGRVVDLTTFGNDATGVVPLFDYAKEGECCWMWLTGVDEDGAALRFDVLQDAPLKPHWLIDGVDTPIARNDLKKLADCSDFKLHFAASFDGKCDRKTAIEFPVQSFAIEQESLVLNPPKVTEAVGSELTAWNGRDGVHVVVSYLGNHPNHTLSLCWTRPDGSCWPLDSQPGSAGETTTFLVPREAVIESIGKTVKINYTVTNACKVQTSKDLNLHISVPVRLTTPEVAQATPPATQGGILDLRTFTADADTLVPNWWFMLAGQQCWLECSGPLWNGSIHTVKVMDAELITAADVTNGLSRVLKRQELDKYETGTELTFTFKVKTYAGDDDRAAIVFPVLKLLFRKRLYDETPLNPEGRGWNGWQRGAGATDPRDLKLDYGPYNWGTGYWLTNLGWTDTTDPATQSEILFRVFNNLEPGRLYKFHAWVRDDNNVPNPSLLVLRADGVDITPVFTPNTNWYLLEGSFTASAATVRLSFNNLRMGAGPGNDFRVTWLRVYEPASSE